MGDVVDEDTDDNVTGTVVDDNVGPVDNVADVVGDVMGDTSCADEVDSDVTLEEVPDVAAEVNSDADADEGVVRPE